MSDWRLNIHSMETSLGFLVYKRFCTNLDFCQTSVEYFPPKNPSRIPLTNLTPQTLKGDSLKSLWCPKSSFWQRAGSHSSIWDRCSSIWTVPNRKFMPSLRLFFLWQKHEKQKAAIVSLILLLEKLGNFGLNETRDAKFNPNYVQALLERFAAT